MILKKTAQERLTEAAEMGHTISHEEVIERLEHHRKGHPYYGSKGNLIGRDALAFDAALVALDAYRLKNK